MIVILIDTLRADRVGWAGHGRKLTPFLDELASRATVFEQAHASSSWTAPSVASLFTSRFPSQHRIVRFRSILAAEETTLAEVLQASGYLTAGFSANVSVAPHAGFDQGFGDFIVRPEKRAPLVKGSAEEINRAVLAWHDGLTGSQRQKPLFLYVQYMEPHTPYLAPDDILTKTLALRGSPAEARRGVERARAAFWFRREAEATDWVASLDGEQRQGIIDLYDAEVAHIDGGIRQLFAALETRGVLSDAVVVVTADHGEELFDHGGYAHGHTLYEEVTHVPLAIHIPGQSAGKVWSQPVSLVDLAPTLLNLLSIPAPAAFEGHSLLPLLDVAQRSWLGSLLPSRHESTVAPTFSELFPLDRNKSGDPPQQAVVQGHHKLIASPPSQIAAFDLESDPGEHDPSGLNDEDRARLSERLGRFNQRVALRAAVAATPAELDEATRQRLHALGYAD